MRASIGRFGLKIRGQAIVWPRSWKSNNEKWAGVAEKSRDQSSNQWIVATSDNFTGSLELGVLLVLCFKTTMSASTWVLTDGDIFGPMK